VSDQPFVSHKTSSRPIRSFKKKYCYDVSGHFFGYDILRLANANKGIIMKRLFCVV